MSTRPPAHLRHPLARALPWLALALAWLVGASVRARQPAADAAPLRVVVTIPALEGLVRPLLPPGATLRTLMPVGSSEHSHDFTPADLAAVAGADVAVRVGLGLEPRIAQELRERPRPGRVELCFAEVVSLQAPGEPEPNTAQAIHHEHAPGEPCDHHAEGYVDQHLWLDPALVEKFLPSARDALARALRARDASVDLAALDAALATELARVREMDERFRERLAPFAGQAIVTQHDAFSRLADRYSLRVVRAIDALDSAELTPAQLKQCVEAVRTHRVRAIFAEPQRSDKPARRLAQLTGVRLGTLDPMGQGDWHAMMARNLDALTLALGEAQAPRPTPRPKP